MTNLTLRLRGFCIVLSTALLMISGCKSTSEPKISTRTLVTPPVLIDYPADVKVVGSDILDIQLALGDRNLYLGHDGNIKMRSIAQCPMDISAHRGDFRLPESSASAISSALNDNFNSVEIDVMLLKDGTWVNHHDKQTGRATVHYTGKRYTLERMTLNEFAELKLRDKHSHDLLDTRPITAYESFKTFAAYRNPEQKLNVEIKSATYGQKLVELDRMLRQIVGQGNFYYSSADLDTLDKLRGINTEVYLGFIQSGHPTSVEILQKSLHRGVNNDAYYLNNQKQVELVGRYGIKRYRSRYKNYASNQGIRTLVAQLGSNSGLHLDIRSYMQHQQVKTYAQNFGMKIYTYSLNGTDYHQSQLMKLSHAKLPDGAIVDTTPLKICQQLFTLAVPLQRYYPISPIGKYIVSLPVDADFDEFEQMQGYQNEDYYISLTSGLRAIKHITTMPPQRKKNTTPQDLDFPVIVDEDIEIRRTDTIILTLPSNNNDQ